MATSLSIWKLAGMLVTPIHSISNDLIRHDFVFMNNSPSSFVNPMFDYMVDIAGEAATRRSQPEQLSDDQKGLLFFNKGHPRPQTNITDFCNSLLFKNAHPAFGNGIRNHDLLNVSFLP